MVPPEPRDFRVGDLVWGPAHGFPSWPGKLVRGSGERAEGKVWVCWFGTRDLSEVEGHRLKTLSEGLEAHHRERKKSRRWAQRESFSLKAEIFCLCLELMHHFPLCVTSCYQFISTQYTRYTLNWSLFQGTQDEHKLGESHPGGHGRTRLRISGGVKIMVGRHIISTWDVFNSGDD